MATLAASIFIDERRSDRRESSIIIGSQLSTSDEIEFFVTIDTSGSRSRDKTALTIRTKKKMKNIVFLLHLFNKWPCRSSHSRRKHFSNGNFNLLIDEVFRTSSFFLLFVEIPMKPQINEMAINNVTKCIGRSACWMKQQPTWFSSLIAIKVINYPTSIAFSLNHVDTSSDIDIIGDD